MVSKSELWKNLTASEARGLTEEAMKYTSIDHILCRVHAASTHGKSTLSLSGVSPEEEDALRDLGYMTDRLINGVTIQW